MALRPLLDFDSGYVRRAAHRMPRQGDQYPWEMSFDYTDDRRILERGPVIEPQMELAAAPDLTEKGQAA